MVALILGIIVLQTTRVASHCVALIFGVTRSGIDPRGTWVAGLDDYPVRLSSSVFKMKHYQCFIAFAATRLAANR